MQGKAVPSFIHPDMQVSPHVRCSRCASGAVRAIIEVVDPDTKDIRMRVVCNNCGETLFLETSVLWPVS